MKLIGGTSLKLEMVMQKTRRVKMSNYITPLNYILVLIIIIII